MVEAHCGTDQLTNNRRVVNRRAPPPRPFGAVAPAGRPRGLGPAERRWAEPRESEAVDEARASLRDRDLGVTVAGGASAVSGWHGASARLPWPLANRSGRKEAEAWAL